MVQIEILGGKREIGGNCVRITDKDKVILFDQGIRFSVFKAFYSRLIQPLGIPELRQLRIIPAVATYENIETIYISHFHLDHLGLLSNIPCETVVKLPSLRIYQALEEGWRMSPSWPVFIPPRFFVKTEDTIKYRTDKNNVIAIPVSHSAYPAHAFIFFGSDETILYTGDLRLTSIKTVNQILHKETIFKYLEENTDIKIDKLIIEGTNLGRPLTPIRPNEAKETINRLFEKEKLVLTAIHQLDAESLVLIASVAKTRRKKLLLASPRLAKILEALYSATPKIKCVLEKTVVLEDTVKESTILNRISIGEVKKELSGYCMVTDIARLDEILRKFEPLSDELVTAPVILMISEPSDEEAIFDIERLTRWLSLYGLQPYNIRVSGHYYPYELKPIIQKIKPKEVIPIHTRYPEYMYALSK